MATYNPFYEKKKDRQIYFCFDGKKQVLEFEKKLLLSDARGNVPPEEQAYTLRAKRFQGEEPLNGECLEELMDERSQYAAIKEDRYGDKVLYEYVSIPTFDSEDREWDSYMKYALIYDGREIDVIAYRGGYKLAKIEAYIGLTAASKSFEPYLMKLEYPAHVMKRIRWIPS